MHVRTLWRFLILFMFTTAFDFNDLDLSKKYSCMFSYNRPLYVLSQTNDVSVSFGSNRNIDLPRISSYPNNNNSSVCTITKSGTVFLFSRQIFHHRYLGIQPIFLLKEHILLSQIMQWHSTIRYTYLTYPFMFLIQYNGPSINPMYQHLHHAPLNFM
ncbi:uncharacterized protein B0P05DRAFT_537282, partial [Gilbertella persicaria]|uniref:uncharacterized protein n=1 Tax=Gilbertella persicaria TaxID=101096 RepID=UPI0022210938